MNQQTLTTALNSDLNEARREVLRNFSNVLKSVYGWNQLKEPPPPEKTLSDFVDFAMQQMAGQQAMIGRLRSVILMQQGQIDELRKGNPQ